MSFGATPSYWAILVTFVVVNVIYVPATPPSHSRGSAKDPVMPLSLDDALTIAPDVMFRHLSDEAVLLDLKRGIYFGLNDVGARTWHLILEHGRLAHVLDVLLKEYDIDRDACERDLLALAGQLVARELAAVKPDAR